MKMDKIGSAVREMPMAPGIREIISNKESALNLAVVVEEELHDALSVTSAAGPVPPDTVRVERLTSLMAKINVMAQSGEGDQDLQLTLPEQRELMPILGKYQRGLDMVKNAEQFMSDEDLETVVRVMALNPRNSEIAGILALNSEMAKDRVARAMKVYAFKNPGEYAAAMNDLATSRNFLKSDWEALGKIFEVTGKYGIDKGTVMQCLELDNWKELLVSAAAARMQRRPTFAGEMTAGINQLGFRHDIARIEPMVERYHLYTAERIAVHERVNETLRSVFTEEGVAGTILTQEALDPNAPAETKAAYDSLRGVQNRVNTLMQNNNAFNTTLRTDLSADPLWAHHTDPAASETLASNWLENRYQGDMNAASTERGFWGAIFGLLSSMLGVAYTKEDVQKTAAKIRSL